MKKPIECFGYTRSDIDRIVEAAKKEALVRGISSDMLNLDIRPMPHAAAGAIVCNGSATARIRSRIGSRAGRWIAQERVR